MCGRYSLFAEPEELARIFHLSLEEVARVFTFGPRYNIAPTDPVLAVRCGPDAAREPVAVRWGLVPHWARDSEFGARTINARAETVATKPAFRDPFRYRRCLIPASGFFEWKKSPGGKQPYFFRLRDGGTLAFAGLWDKWEGSPGAVVESCAIVTTRPNSLTRAIHDRMPVILRPEDHDDWLASRPLDPSRASQMMAPIPVHLLTGYPVSTRVGRVGTEGADLVEPVGPPLESPLELDLAE